MTKKREGSDDGWVQAEGGSEQTLTRRALVKGREAYIETEDVRITAGVVQAYLRANASGLSKQLVLDTTRRAVTSARAALKEEDGDGLRVRVPDLSKARPPVFVWEDRLLAGYLNLLLGEEGVGKSTLAAWIISRLTRGNLPGAFEGRPVGVGVMSDEDAFEDSWTPRLYAAGADLRRVRQIDRPDGGFVHIGEDRALLSQAAERHSLEVFFFDQLLDNLGTDVDVFHQKKVRDALQPIRALARELEMAVIGSMHPNKQGKSFRQLVFGSGFNQVCRSALWLAKDPDDPDLRVVVRGKGNLSVEPNPLTFRIQSEDVSLNDQTWGVPLATDFGQAETSVDDLLDSLSEGRRRQQDHSKVGHARQVIDEALPRDGEWHDARPIIEAAGIEERTVRKARQDLGVETRQKPGTFPAVTEWRWPSTQKAQAGQ
jgi:hypothetical protein